MKLKTTTMPLIRQKLSAHRLAIGIITVVVLLLGAYGLWSKHIWDNYETNYNVWHSSTQAKINAALGLPAATNKQRSAKLATLKKTSDAITAAKGSLCGVNGLVGWQGFIGALHNRQEACQKLLDTSVTFNEKLKAATGYLDNEQALARVISAIPASKPQLAEGDWEAQATAWHEAAAKIDTLAVSANFVPTKQTAQTATKKIEAAWQEVIAAHKVKDKARYLKAQSQLADSYATLHAMTETSTQKLKLLLDPLQTAYKQAF